jgi:hypothetical protein
MAGGQLRAVAELGDGDGSPSGGGGGAGDEAPPMFLFGADRPLTPLAELGPDGLRADTLMPELPLKRVMAGGIRQRYHRPVRPGDRLTIMSFTEIEAAEAKFWKPQVIVLGEKNAIIDERGI